MKHANKRLIVSLAALVISIALAATSTFAWFTMNATPQVSNINLTVTTQDGLDIAYLNPENGLYTSYRSYFDFTEIDPITGHAYSAYFASYRMDALTPADAGVYTLIGYVFQKTGVVAGSATVAGGYVLDYDEFLNPVYMLDESDDPIVAQDASGAEIPGVYVQATENVGDYVESNSDDQTFVAPYIDHVCIPVYSAQKVYSAGNTTTFVNVDSETNTANTVTRTSGTYVPLTFKFRSLNQYTIRIKDVVAGTTITNGVAAFNDTQTIAPWYDSDIAHESYLTPTCAPNAVRLGFEKWAYDSGTGSFEADETLSLVYKPNESRGYEAVGTFTGSSSYYKARTGNAPIITQPQVEAADYLLINKNSTSVPTHEDDNVVITMSIGATGTADEGYYVAQITVYIWMEGTDPDCFNEILNQNFSLLFSFLAD